MKFEAKFPILTVLYRFKILQVDIKVFTYFSPQVNSLPLSGHVSINVTKKKRGQKYICTLNTHFGYVSITLTNIYYFSKVGEKGCHMAFNIATCGALGN